MNNLLPSHLAKPYVRAKPHLRSEVQGEESSGLERICRRIKGGFVMINAFSEIGKE